MGLDKVTKVEIAAHTSVMDDLLEYLQTLSIIQVDPHSVKQWESDKTEIEKGRERLSNLKNKLTEVTRAIEYLERYAPKVSIFQKFSIQPEELPLDELKERVKKSNAELVLDSAIELQKKEDELNTRIKELQLAIEELEPFKSFTPKLIQLTELKTTGVFISKLDKETAERIFAEQKSPLIHIEKIYEDETQVYFYLIYHRRAEEEAEKLIREYRLEAISLPSECKKSVEILEENKREIQELLKKRVEISDKARELAGRINLLKYLSDWLETEIEKESVKERLFFTKKVFLIHGWIKESDFSKLVKELEKYREVSCSIIEREKEEIPPVVYKNNRFVSPFELIVNLYSPPNPKEIDPTPILAPFYALFFGICLTEAGYGLVIALLSFLALVFLKPRGGMRKFLNLFLLLGISTFVVGALIGTVFGINFDALPENLQWLKEARYKIMIFDSSKDVLTFFGLSLALGVLHLITGYVIKIYMLIRDGEWVEAVCDHLPWIFLLLAPAPKVLIKMMPQYEGILNSLFYALIALWAGIILIFSERSTLNPIKRIGKGLFTLYGVSGVLGDVLSYSRLLALGLATGVIAGVMNTLAKMVREIPVVGIVGFVGVLIVGHLFNLFISGLSAFVHSIRLQFMEFFTKFFTGEGELLTPFSEKRRYTFVPMNSTKKG